MSKSKEVFRYHDRVRIINPEVFIRCGYPLTKQMIKDTMTKEQLDAIHTMFHSFGIITDISKLPPDQIAFGLRTYIERIDDKAFSRVRDVIAGCILEQEGWGGKERKIYTERREDLLNATATVHDKRVVKTGTHVSGYTYRGYFDSYDDYEPPRLDCEETHVILKVHTDWGTNYPSVEIEIEKCNVEKIAKDIRDPDHFIISND